MIPAPPIGLIQQIEIAHQKNSEKISREIGIPQTDISTEAALQLKHFGAWCKSKGIKALPCAPTSLAAFVRAENAIGVPVDRIVDALWAIEALHDNNGYANPVATAAVRVELDRILKFDRYPRWPKADKLKFLLLPPDIKAVIARREEQNTRVLRKIQNDFAAFKTQKENSNG